MRVRMPSVAVAACAVAAAAALWMATRPRGPSLVQAAQSLAAEHGYRLASLASAVPHVSEETAVAAARLVFMPPPHAVVGASLSMGLPPRPTAAAEPDVPLWVVSYSHLALPEVGSPPCFGPGTLDLVDFLIDGRSGDLLGLQESGHVGLRFC